MKITIQTPAGTTHPAQSSGGFLLSCMDNCSAWKFLEVIVILGGRGEPSSPAGARREVLVSGFKDAVLSRQSLGNQEGQGDAARVKASSSFFVFSTCLSVILLWDQACRLLLQVPYIQMCENGF